MSVSQITAAYRNIPVAVKQFLLKVLVLLVVWKSLYVFLLAPARVPDGALTNLTSQTTAWTLRLFYDDIRVHNDLKQKRVHMFLGEKLVVDIADPCNALELYILYIGFLICMPANIKRQIVFGLLGVVAIFTANVLRCTALFWFHLERQTYFDYVHKYVFTLVVYGIIFLCWMLYTRTDAPKKSE